MNIKWPVGLAKAELGNVAYCVVAVEDHLLHIFLSTCTGSDSLDMQRPPKVKETSVCCCHCAAVAARRPSAVQHAAQDLDHEGNIWQPVSSFSFDYDSQ